MATNVDASSTVRSFEVNSTHGYYGYSSTVFVYDTSSADIWLKEIFVYYDFRLYLQSAPGILASFNENLNSPIGVAYARLLKSHSVDYD